MYTVKRVWTDKTEEPREGSVDVLAEMEDDTLWMARFATIPYIQEQMKVGFEASHDLGNTPAACYATIETQHIIVDCLTMETIENVIDNLLELGVFESMFAPVNGREITDYLAGPAVAAR